MTRTVDLSGLEAAIKKTAKKLGQLTAENAKLTKQLAAAKKRKGSPAESGSNADETVAEVRERLVLLESNLESLLSSGNAS